MEWQAPAIVLEARPHGEGGAVVSLLTREHGRHPGLVKGGAARGQAALWQPGNLVEARWVARLPEQLGALSGELIHAAAALALDDPLALAMLDAVTATAAGALPEREPHPNSFAGLLALIARLPEGAERSLGEVVRWEATLLAELGYGLDLERCAATGATEDLAFVSPKSGRAVSAAAAGPWRERLFTLPAFLRDETAVASLVEAHEGLRLTGHFLARDAFGHQHRPLPEARHRLADRVAALAAGR